MISLSKLSERYGIQIRRAKRLIEAGKLKVIIESNKNGSATFICQKSVEKFLLEQNSFLSKHVNAKEALEELQIISPSNLHVYINNYDDMNKNFDQASDFLRVVRLPGNYYSNALQVNYFRRKDIETLKKDYVNLVEARNLAGINDGSSFTKWLKRREFIQVFSFGTLRSQRFIKKDALEKGITGYQRRAYKRPKENLLNQKETRELLNISVFYFKALLDEGTLAPSMADNLSIYYDKDEVLNLVKRQKTEYKELSKLYYSRNDILDLFPDINIGSLVKADSVERINLPPYLVAYFKGDNTKPYEMFGKYLYSKEHVNEFNNQTQIRKAIFDGTVYVNPFDDYQNRVKVLRIKFSKATKNTEELWLRFVSENLSFSDSNQEYTIENYVQVYTRAAEAISELIDKEIYNYTSNELNILFINNDELIRTAREYIYTFLVFIDKIIQMKYPKKKPPFDINRIINPRTLPRKNFEKKIYTEKEYSLLFKYASDDQKHRIKAVSDAIAFIENGFDISNYNRYDSVWLYVLVHLNNAWRNSDCLSIPRISLEGTTIKDLSWLLHNRISELDAKKIIFRMKAADMSVSKTGAERHFFCSSELERAMATAIAICELRTQAHNDLMETIVYKVNNKGGEMAVTPKKAFFKEFSIKNFDFQNRAMNRTLISLIVHVQSVMGDGKNSEYIRILRSHVDFETTNIYINLSQERIDEISLHLFDRDMFGHIPKVLTELVLGETDNEFTDTERIQNVKSSFGDIYKVQEMAGFLNEIHVLKADASQDFLKNNQDYKDIVEEIIREMSPSEVESLYNRMITGQLPSKKKHYQCIVSEDNCKFPGRDCESCPLSIPHFYAISSLVERIFQKAKVIKDSFSEEITSAEKTRLANWVALDLELLKEAQKKYGKQEIAMFATGLNEQLKLINPIRSYQSIDTKSEV